jgi:hypothetical protein
MRKRVRIELIKGSWRVIYVDRAKHGRHQAACFYAEDTDYGRVVEWVKNNHKLELVDTSTPLR